MLANGEYEQYWQKVCGEELSEEFKDLITGMFQKDPKKRLTLQQIRQHPWMKRRHDQEAVRLQIMERLAEKKVKESGATVSTAGTSFGDEEKQKRAEEAAVCVIESPVKKADVKRFKKAKKQLMVEDIIDKTEKLKIKC